MKQHSEIVAACEHELRPSSKIDGFDECSKCGLAQLAAGPERDAMLRSRAQWDAQRDDGVN